MLRQVRGLGKLVLEEILVTAQKEGGEIGLCVCDSGPGFPAELLQRGIQEFGTGRPGGPSSPSVWGVRTPWRDRVSWRK